MLITVLAFLVFIVALFNLILITCSADERELEDKEREEYLRKRRENCQQK